MVYKLASDGLHQYDYTSGTVKIQIHAARFQLNGKIFFRPPVTPFTMPPVSSLTMQNGVAMPQIGLGTWEANNPEELKAALRTAFDAGYRHIDTAYFYGNEATIGELIEEYTAAKKLSRAELFITTKVRSENPFNQNALLQWIRSSDSDMKIWSDFAVQKASRLSFKRNSSYRHSRTGRRTLEHASRSNSRRSVPTISTSTSFICPPQRRYASLFLHGS